MNIEELKDFINKSTIPEVKAIPKTFLGIAKQPHYENVLSNLYAFYFTTDEEHNLKNLFISSLINIISSKSNNTKGLNSASSIVTETELSTKKGGRIDIVLYGDDFTIIIENKVYHWLANDLTDYWNSINEKNKIGIILSLHPISQIAHHDFINITHIELLSEVFNNIGSYLLNSDNKYLIFLKDIYQNIINLTNKMDNKQIQFYFENQDKINDIISVKNNIVEHVKSEVDKACELVSDELTLGHKRGEGYRYYTSSEDKNLMFTIYFESIFSSEKVIYIMIELQGEAIDLIKNNENIKFLPEEKLLISEGIENCNDSYFHYVSIPYEINERNINELARFIIEKIKNDGFLSIFEKLEKALSK